MQVTIPNDHIEDVVLSLQGRANLMETGNRVLSATDVADMANKVGEVSKLVWSLTEHQRATVSFLRGLADRMTVRSMVVAPGGPPALDGLGCLVVSRLLTRGPQLGIQLLDEVRQYGPWGCCRDTFPNVLKRLREEHTILNQSRFGTDPLDARYVASVYGANCLREAKTFFASLEDACRQNDNG